jgi:hypothetical protein
MRRAEAFTVALQIRIHSPLIWVMLPVAGRDQGSIGSGNQ